MKYIKVVGIIIFILIVVMIANSDKERRMEKNDIICIPQPQSVKSKGFNISLDSSWIICVNTSNSKYNFSAKWLKERLNLSIADLNSIPPNKRIVLGDSKHPCIKNILQERNIEIPIYIGEEGYILEIFDDPKEIIIVANSPNGVFYGVQTLLQLISQNSIKAVSIIDYPDHKIRAIYVSRSTSPLYFGGDYDEAPIFTQEQKEYIDKLASWKINTLIYCDRHGDFFKGYIEAYKELKAYCEERFIDFIPSIATLRNYYGFPFELLEGWWIRDEKFVFNDSIAIPCKPFENLLDNGGFEIDENNDGFPDGWEIHTWGDGEIEVDNSTKYEGNYSLKIKNGYISKTFSVESNKHYHLTAMGRGYKPRIYLTTIDDSGNSLYAQSDYTSSNISYWHKFGVTLRTNENTSKIRIKIYGDKKNCWIDDVRFYRVDGGLKNVIRTETTDIEITNLNKTVTYREGIDYIIINGTTDLLFDDEMQSFIIQRLEGGNISAGQEVLVSYDSRLYYARSRNYNQPPCISDERIYTNYYYPAIDKVIENLTPNIIFFASDEIRGFNRDSRNLKRNMSNAELLAEWLNKINTYVKSKDPNCRIMIWDDMVSPYHNGGVENYQLPYGGSPGRMAEVIEQDMIDNDIIMAVWWYNNERLSQMKATTKFFASKGFNYFGCPWYDFENIQNWSELLACDPNSLGGIDTDWGIGNIDEHYSFFADHFWNTRYKVIYFDSFEEDLDENAFPDNWHYTGENESVENLLQNPSFEENFTYWEIIGTNSDTPSIDNTTFYDGNKSAYFKSDGSSRSAIRSDFIPVNPNTEYELEAWIKGKNITVGNASWKRFLWIGRWYNSNYTQIHDIYPDLSFDLGTYDWKLFKGSCISPSNASYYRITHLGIYTTSKGEGWADNLSFHKYIPPPYCCDGEHMQGKRYANFPNCAISVKGDSVWYSEPIPVEYTSEYILSAYIRRQSPGEEKPMLKLVWLDANFQEIFENIKSIDNVTTEYQYYEMRAPFPMNASFVRICLKGEENGTEYFWFDTLRLLRFDILPYALFLRQGWNLITIPIENNFKASSLYSSIEYCQIILSWNVSKQNFDIYVPSSPYNFDIENGKGYFVGISNDTIFYIYGIFIESVNVTLYEGWNVLGWFKNDTKASSLYENITGCITLLKWNTSKENFDLYVPYAPDFTIHKGEGFLVAVDEESIWHGEG